LDSLDPSFFVGYGFRTQEAELIPDLKQQRTYRSRLPILRRDPELIRYALG